MWLDCGWHLLPVAKWVYPICSLLASGWKQLWRACVDATLLARWPVLVTELCPACTYHNTADNLNHWQCSWIRLPCLAQGNFHLHLKVSSPQCPTFSEIPERVSIPSLSTLLHSFTLTLTHPPFPHMPHSFTLTAHMLLSFTLTYPPFPHVSLLHPHTHTSHHPHCTHASPLHPHTPSPCTITHPPHYTFHHSHPFTLILIILVPVPQINHLTYSHPVVWASTYVYMGMFTLNWYQQQCVRLWIRGI